MIVALTGIRTAYAQEPTTTDGGDFTVVYETTTVYPKLPQVLKAQDTIETLVGALNAKYALPRTVPIIFKDCGPGGNASFEMPPPRIVLCYDFLHLLGTQLKVHYGNDDAAVGAAMLRALSFFFVHELGHALCAEWHIPGTAQDQEINADQIATLALIEMGERYVQSAIDGANFLRLLGSTAPPDYFDEHLLGEQRFVQTLRLIYGSDPTSYPQIAAILPPARTKQDEATRDAAIVRDFEAVRAKWRSLLKPRELTEVSDEDLARLVAQMEEQPPRPLPSAAPAPSPATSRLQQQPPSTRRLPIYKRWWFWAGIAVGALVLIGVATSGQE